MSKAWQGTLDAGDILLIDGGMGTELQRRGVAMDAVAWSGAAVFTNPDAVRETHEDYIRAGARVITTNTFGSTRQMLEPAGYGDQVRLFTGMRSNSHSKRVTMQVSHRLPLPVRYLPSRRVLIETRFFRLKKNWRRTGKRQACWRSQVLT